MGYFGEQKKAYAREWNRRRRQDFFVGKCCVRCGSEKSLELDHVDPSTKITHNVWTWAKLRRDAELSKCQVLCMDCHRKKTNMECRKDRLGKPRQDLRSISDEQIQGAIELLSSGWSERRIASELGIGKTSVHSIKLGNLRVS